MSATETKLPWAAEAEQSVLGALLIDNDAANRVMGHLDAAAFWHAPHRAIFTTITRLIAAGQPADVVTVFQALEDDGIADDVGGLAYLNDLAQCVPSAANVSRYAAIVADKALRRRIQEIAGSIGDGVNNAATADEALDQALTLLAGLKRVRGRSEPRSIGELMIERSAHWEALQDGTEAAGIPTGLSHLDEALGGGLKPGTVIVLAARPSVGKTSLATQILLHVAASGKPGSILSQEMPAGALMDRAAAHLGRISLGRLSTGHFADDDWDRISEATNRALKLPIYVDDQPALTLLDVRAKARQVQRKQGLTLLVVDYLQLCGNGAGSDSKSRHHQIEAISRGMKVLAKELGITVLLLSQLNRASEGDEPELHHLKESGAIEEDADVVILLHPTGQEAEGCVPMLAKIAKNRQGRRGRLSLSFDGKTQRWETSTSDVSRRPSRAS